MKFKPIWKAIYSSVLSNTTLSRIGASPVEYTMRWRTLGACLGCIAVVALAGCADMGPKLFQRTMDRNVGYPVKDWETYPHDVNALEDGRKEYVFKEKSGCRWAFIVNKDGIVESWKYLSDPALCRRRYGLGPF
jgi:hypothetical protein